MSTAPIAQGPVDVTVSRQCTCHSDDNPPQPCEHRYAFRDCADAAEERYLRETLAMLHESYAKAAKPYIDRLVAINAMRPPAPMIVTLEQAQAHNPATGNPFTSFREVIEAASEVLLAEIAALKKAADRYRWLRENPTWIGYDSDYRADEVDAVIDAAMKPPNAK